MSEHLLVSIIVMSTMGAGVVIIVTALKTWARSRRDRQVNELQAKVLDKLGSASEVMQFVSTESFQQIAAGSVGDNVGAASRVLNTLQNGMVTLCLGAGMLLIAPLANLEGEGRTALLVVGGLVLAVGIGLAVSAAWSYALLKRWGFLEGEKTQPARESAR